MEEDRREINPRKLVTTDRHEGGEREGSVARGKEAERARWREGLQGEGGTTSPSLSDESKIIT